MRTRSTYLSKLILFAVMFFSTSAVSATDIIVDGSKRFQTIEGFGTCLNAWTRIFTDLYRTEAFQKIYVQQVGCNMLRVNMWGPVFEKATEDWTKISYKDFNFTDRNDRAQVFIDFGRGILKLNPDIKIIGTVWSPPAWMKMNKSITDEKSGAIRANDYGEFTNRIDPKYYQHFCKWMVEYVKYHDKQGVPFYAVSPGNEVQFTQSFESCVWNGKDFAQIVIMLREMLDAEGYKNVKIFGPETMTSHMYEGGTGTYVQIIKNDPNALSALDIFATHGYEDGVRGEMEANSSRTFWELIKDTNKSFWITEGGTGDHTWPAPIKNGIGSALHNALVAGNCSAFLPWQATEGSQTEHAFMVMDKYTPKSYTFMHYSRFIQSGAKRIEATPGFSEVQVSAFLHEQNNVLTIVALNSTDQKHELNITLENLKGLSSLKVFRTSATDNIMEINEIKIINGRASFLMIPQSIVTFSGKMSKI
jgi:glucuronoarabinoxylan endo-1,4-beta-xylanase